MMQKEYPAFDPHGNLTADQRMFMTKLTREHIGGHKSPRNVHSDGKFHSFSYGTKGRVA